LLIIAAALHARGLHRLSRTGNHRPHVALWALLFTLGWSALAIALVSPLATESAGLFSAHMVQHEILMVIAAPLMVLSRPLAIWTWALPPGWRQSIARPFRSGAVSSAWRMLTTPFIASVLHAVAIWVWHVPRLFEAAESSIAVHALQHTAFLFSALLFWWTLLKPGHERQTGAAVLCLFFTMLHTAALGVLLTFSSEVWYPVSTAGAAHWGLTPLEDQQLGGLIMWVPGGVPYVIAALALAARWFRKRFDADQALDVAVRTQSR
jgi:cytochrome c oxidase assembly factor CtaG